MDRVHRVWAKLPTPLSPARTMSNIFHGTNNIVLKEVVVVKPSVRLQKKTTPPETNVQFFWR